MFKAEIIKYVKKSTVGSPPIHLITTFSRSKVIGHFDTISKQPYPPNYNDSNRILGEYSFQITTNDFDKKKYEVVILGSIYELKLNWINKVKCLHTHKLLWYQVYADDLKKSIVVAGITILTSVIVGYLTYGLGYAKGLENGKSINQAKVLLPSQDTTHKK